MCAMYQADVYRVLIASPSDLAEERNIATDAVHEWNAQNSAAEAVVLLPVKWETHSMPQAGIRPQEAINRQLAAKCDILLGMFWTKIGTKTGIAESGTVEEIAEFVARGKPTLLYFSARPIDPHKIDLRQQRKLRKFQEQTLLKALVGTFNQLHELRQTLIRDLVHQVRDIKSNRMPATATSEMFEHRLAALQDQVKELTIKFREAQVGSTATAKTRDAAMSDNSDIRTERTILGTILLDNRFALSPEVRALDEEDFSLHSHGVIFKRMMGLADSKEGIDFVTLTEELRRHLELEAVGGVAYVTSLTDGLPRVREIEPYIRIVTLMSKERKRRQ
jgi:DnaB-like helicase N terminal domain